MKPEQLKKMIQEELQEVLSSQYNTIDKILNDLLAGKITKQQAKKFIKAINTNKPERQTGMPAFDDAFGCGSRSAKSKKDNMKLSDWCGGGGLNTNIHC